MAILSHLNVLNYVVWHSSGCILGVIFSICKMKRVPMKNAVRSHKLLEWIHIIIWKTQCNWEPLQDLQSEFGAQLSLTVWHLKRMIDYKPKENILVDLWIRQRVVLWICGAHMLLLKGTTMTQHLGQPIFQGPTWNFGSSKTALTVHLFCRVGKLWTG